MKKQLLFAVVALSAALLVSCKDQNKPEDPSSEASLTVTPKELVLVLGDSPISLTATLKPADAGKTIKWSSSNPDVVSVTNRGYVQALDYGDAYVYASVDDLKDSCYIHVQTFLEAAVFNSAIELDEDTLYDLDKEGKPIVYEIESSSGQKYKAYISLATLAVFSEGFYVNASGKLDGSKEGVILEFQAPMYYASAYLNNTDRPTIFCLGEWSVTDNVEYMRQCEPGSIDEVEYIKQMKDFVAAWNSDDATYPNFLKAAAKAFKNPTLNSYKYETDDSGEGGYYSSRIPEAICKRAKMSLNGNFPASARMCGLDYCEVVYQQLAQDTTFEANWGLNLGYNEETGEVYFNDEKVHFNPETKSVYGDVPAEEEEAGAPAKVQGKQKLVSIPVNSEDKEMAAYIREQIRNHKNVIKFAKH